jgi:hypothetical protein
VVPFSFTSINSPCSSSCCTVRTNAHTQQATCFTSLPVTSTEPSNDRLVGVTSIYSIAKLADIAAPAAVVDHVGVVPSCCGLPVAPSQWLAERFSPTRVSSLHAGTMAFSAKMSQRSALTSSKARTGEQLQLGLQLKQHSSTTAATATATASPSFVSSPCCVSSSAAY